MDANGDLTKAVVTFDKSAMRYRRYLYGHATEEDTGDRIRMTFLMGNHDWLARWLLSFGSAVVVEEPESLGQDGCAGGRDKNSLPHGQSTSPPVGCGCIFNHQPLRTMVPCTVAISCNR